MIYRTFLIAIFLLVSCDFDDNSISVPDINQDNLYHQKFTLNSDISRTIQNYPPNGESSFLYSGQLDSNNYSYAIIDFDNSIFQNYDLCSQDSLSYKKIHLVIDIINEYKITNQDNTYDDNIQNNCDLGLDFDVNWLESDLNLISDFELENIDDIGEKLFLHNYLGKYYLELTSQLSPELAVNECFLVSYEEERENFECCSDKNANACDQLYPIDNIDTPDIDESLIYNDPCIWTNDSCEVKNYCNVISNEDDCIINDQCIWAKESCVLFNSLNICDLSQQDEYYLLIKTAPGSDLLYELASSQYISDYSNTEPYLNIVYNEYKELNKNSNKFILNNISNNIASSLYIKDTLLNDYNYIFIGDSISISENNNEIDDLILWSDYAISSPLDMILNQEYELMQINIDLVNTENFDDSGISFWLDSIKYFKYIEDPHNDNYSIDTNPDGTENNSLFDQSESSDYPGEFLHDFGIDGCYDEHEDGFGGCDSLSAVYNILGTENNYYYDDGEYYEDIGSDGCPDEYETGTWSEDTGIGICSCDYPDGCNENDIVDNADDDPNQDNYNIDPSDDDWFDINNNNEWDERE